jgi:translation initiation factor 3 subunit F
MTDLEILEAALLNISSMLERIHTYVQAVLKGERKGDPAVGRYLMDHLGMTTAELEKGAFVGNLQVISLLASACEWTIDRRTTSQDTLMVSYLANLVRAQAEVSSRLALVSA